MKESLLIGQAFCFAFLSGAISATILIALEKWGVIEYYEIHKGSALPDPCMFCLGFWLCLIQALSLSLFLNSNIFYIAGAFAGASIAKMIYDNAGNKNGRGYL